MSNASTAPIDRAGVDSVPTSMETPADAHSTALNFLRLLALDVSKGSVDLPCFPDVVVRIRRALTDPNTSTEKMIAIIGNEPRLAARLLQTANSVAFNTSGKPLTDLRSAIVRLGQQLVHSAALAYAVQQMKYAGPLRCIAKPLAELWRDCISVAAVSQAVAKHTKTNPDEAFLTGLLHGIGRLYILARSVGNTEFGTGTIPLDLVGDWHASIGKAVLENWGFAEEMCEAIGEQDDHQRRWRHDSELVDILIISIALAATLKNPQLQMQEITSINSFQNLRLTESNCTTILAEAKEHLGSLHAALGA